MMAAAREVTFEHGLRACFANNDNFRLLDFIWYCSILHCNGPFDQFYAVEGFEAPKPSPAMLKQASSSKRNPAQNLENKKKAPSSAAKPRPPNSAFP